MAAEETRGLPLFIRAVQQALATRWLGLLRGVATEQLVALAVLRDIGADLVTSVLDEPRLQI